MGLRGWRGCPCPVLTLLCTREWGWLSAAAKEVRELREAEQVKERKREENATYVGSMMSQLPSQCVQCHPIKCQWCMRVESISITQ